VVSLFSGRPENAPMRLARKRILFERNGATPQKGRRRMTDLNMTDEEVAAEFAKIQARRNKQKEYMARPEVKEKMKAYQKERADRQKAILAKAAEQGLELD